MSAIISLCGTYRYRLERKIEGFPESKACVFVMLNPSTADSTEDDPTIRRCIGFASRFACGKLIVVNLYAYRTPYPTVLFDARDPIGPDNDEHLKMVLLDEGNVKIAAWGSAVRAADRAAEVFKRFGPFKCLGINKTGTPRHPLYVQANKELENFQ